MVSDVRFAELCGEAEGALLAFTGHELNVHHASVGRGLAMLRDALDAGDWLAVGKAADWLDRLHDSESAAAYTTLVMAVSSVRSLGRVRSSSARVSAGSLEKLLPDRARLISGGEAMWLPPVPHVIAKLLRVFVAGVVTEAVNVSEGRHTIAVSVDGDGSLRLVSDLWASPVGPFPSLADRLSTESAPVPGSRINVARFVSAWSGLGGSITVDGDALIVGFPGV